MNWKETDFEGLKAHTKEVLGDMEFDLEGDLEGGDSTEVAIYKQMLQEANEKLIKYEKFLADKNLLEEADSSYISDEEVICLQGINSIKQLVVQGVFTKDDINAFDILHRNLCLIRGIKIDKNSVKKGKTPSTREELLKVINGAKK